MTMVIIMHPKRYFPRRWGHMPTFCMQGSWRIIAVTVRPTVSTVVQSLIYTLRDFTQCVIYTMRDLLLVLLVSM